MDPTFESGDGAAPFETVEFCAQDLIVLADGAVNEVELSGAGRIDHQRTADDGCRQCF